jgi:hypothetical protein
LQQLGIELIAAYSPQARGRKERLYGTLQGRWPQELRVRGLTTVSAANAWLKAEGMAAFNTRFTVPAAQVGSAFVPASPGLERIFSMRHERIVGNDNTVRFGRRVLQLGPTALRWSFAKCRVTVHEHLDDTLSVIYGPHTLARFTADGQVLTQIDEDRPTNDASGGARNDDRRGDQTPVSPSSQRQSARAVA